MLPLLMKKLIYLLCLLAAGSHIYAQQGLTNVGRMQVHGGNLSVAGTFTNTSTASFTNNGALTIKSNLHNAQTGMTTGTGTLRLNGTSVQQITGTHPWRTHHLITQNNAGVSLVNKLEVTGQHQFLAGVIQTSGTGYLQYGNDATYTGAADNRHVDGTVRKSGTTAFQFPVGNGTVYRPVELSSIQQQSNYEVRYGQAAPYTNQIHNGLVAVFPTEYWELQTISGGAAVPTLAWDYAKVAMPAWALSEVRVAQLAGTVWSDAGGSAVGIITGQGSITAPAMLLSGLYTFGQKSAPLPLTLVSFSAKRSGDATMLAWQTVAEQGVERFAVERSNDGLHFTEIASLPARNRSSEQRYQWTDATPINRVAYYRLRCIDLDGNVKMSQVVAVTDAVSNSLALVTNPVRHAAQIRVPAEMSGKYNYTITNAAGQVVQQGSVVFVGGGIATLALGQQVLPGVYFLKLTNSTQGQMLRFVRD